MVKPRKVVVNSRNEEVEEGDPTSAVILNLDVAEERGVKLLPQKKAAKQEEAAVEPEKAPEAKQVDGPAENKAMKAPVGEKGR